MPSLLMVSTIRKNNFQPSSRPKYVLTREIRCRRRPDFLNEFRDSSATPDEYKHPAIVIS